MIKGNKGEWSELYTLIKLLADSQIFGGNNMLEKISDLVYPIIKVIRQETNKGQILEYEIDSNFVLINSDGEQLTKIPVHDFKQKAIVLLKAIKENKKGSFSIPTIESFMHSIGCLKLKSKSSKKTDIQIVVYDARIQQEASLGFSIKSQLGGAATLFNASKSTNFIFEILGDLNESQIHEINSINSRSKIGDRLKTLQELDIELKFHSCSNNILYNNLILVDSRLPEILGNVLLIYNLKPLSKLSDIIDQLKLDNPLEFNTENDHKFYEYKVKRFLPDVALGMMPTKIWDGQIEANGGYIVVKEDGELVCYHVYNRNVLEEYLFYNTRLDTPSSSRNDFGYVYSENRKLFIKLNLQIRFLY